MPDVQLQRISGHSPYEPVFGFSRAVVAGDRVLGQSHLRLRPCLAAPQSASGDELSAQAESTRLTPRNRRAS